jgi:hypothetical protein
VKGANETVHLHSPVTSTRTTQSPAYVHMCMPKTLSLCHS